MARVVKDSLSEISKEGNFTRTPSVFRSWIRSPDEPPEKSHFLAEKNRYHLYISFACPWANRCYTILKLKGLEDVIGVTVVHPTWQKTSEDINDKHYGWAFWNSESGSPLSSPTGYGSFAVNFCTLDTINGARFIRDLYEITKDPVTLQEIPLDLKPVKFSVPVLWDKKEKCIVNNESSEIISILNSSFNHLGKEVEGFGPSYNFKPDDLASKIDEINDLVYPTINDGVYKCGFARTQEAYEEAVTKLFESLDFIEQKLQHSRYLVDNVRITEADIRLFMTLVRFDEVYVVYFKTNKKRLIDYENIRNYMRDIYQLPGLKDTIQMDHIKIHYFRLVLVINFYLLFFISLFFYSSHPTLNHYAIIPKGPNVIEDLLQPHNRNKSY